MKFQIEYIAHTRRPVHLFARQLDAGDFRVSAQSHLGEVALQPYLAQPRKTTPEGKPDFLVFAFALATAEDSSKLQVGQVVELWDASL